MAFTKITSAMLADKGVTGLPDVPGLSTSDMQAKFDELSLDVIVPAYNNTVDQLTDNAAAAAINGTDPVDSTVKSVQDIMDSIKSNTDTELAGKADNGTTLSDYGITDAYTKTEADNLLAAKADSGTTLSDYGITDAYTKTETDNQIAAEAALHYTKTEADNLLATKADAATTLAGYGITDAYTNTETDTLLAGKVDTVTGKGLSTNDYDNDEKADVAANTAARHTHSNLTVLDAITSAVKSGYDALVTLFSGITGIETTVTNDDTKLPTGGAIVDYVTSLGGGDMTKAVYDADNDGIVDNSEALEGHAATYFAIASAETAAGTSYDNSVSGLAATDTQDAIDELASGKQDALSFDLTPASGSSNPVTSDGVYAADLAIQNQVDVLSAGQGSGGSKTTVFNNDGSITETWAGDGSYKTTVFNNDGSITETMYDSSNVAQWTKTTVFNNDGSITETVS